MARAIETLFAVHHRKALKVLDFALSSNPTTLSAPKTLASISLDEIPIVLITYAILS